MKAFTQHTGIVVPFDRAGVDTDQIMPKQFLKRIERTGYGQFLFYNWRFLDDDLTPNPQFELNRPQLAGATILLTRSNFGCGSSREHAVWGIEQYGFCVIIAESFADIFYNNCFKNGVLPITLGEQYMAELFRRATPLGYRLRVNLRQNEILDVDGLRIKFKIDPFRRHCLLNGLDDIALTLQHKDEITKYEAVHGII